MPTATKSMLRTALGLTLCLLTVNCGAKADRAAAVGSGSKDPAVALIEQVARAYREAPALVDECKITMTTRGRSRTDTNVVWLGPGTDARVSIEGYEMTAVDGQFMIEHVDRPAKYVQTPLDKNLLKSFASLSGGAGLPVPQVELRYGETTDDYIAAFGLGKAVGLRIQGVATIQRDGKTFDELTMSNDQGATVQALIDPATKFVTTITLITPGSEYVLTMAPKRLKKLPARLVLNTTDRRRVETIQSLMSLSAGDDAPNITLETLDGREVSLADHRGSLVVIDFWATWCPPCRQGLPKLQEFSTWAEGQGLPVKVLPVDMGEKPKTRALKKAVVSRYWKTAGYTMPTLMDYDNTAARAYQVGSIPHTVIVDPQGKIVKIEIGFNRNAVQELKELARRTFGG
ncbi:MAG: TlpA family protein disulfide reductase [Planctomycetota bacterium]|nr:MAG: TlpA family protein disulfide reductase [Planctomycetota bacterium]